MSIGINNADSSFFNITSDDIDLFNSRRNKDVEEKIAINEDIISLTIVEECQKINSGTLQIYDPNLVYPRLLRMGMRLNISWGYEKPDDNIRTLLAFNKNPTETTGLFKRTGMSAYITSPSGSGNERGFSVYNCNFYGSEFSKNKERKVYKNGTKSSVVLEVLDRMGVDSAEILFTRGTEIIKPDTQIVQWQSDFKFLQKMAREWRAIFRIGHTPLGTLHAIFIDYDKFNIVQFQKIVTGAAFGNTIYLGWKWDINNVRSYTWQNHAGESGTGDHIRLVQIDGRQTFIKYVAEKETVKAYRFMPEKVTAEIKRKMNIGNISSVLEYVNWAMNVQDFEEIKDYFTPYEESTAPQGLGYTINLNMLGNPLITPPLGCSFGKGFPDIFSDAKLKQNKMFIRRVEHKIDRSGYTIQAEAVDTLTYTGGSFVI
jgi:phage protein D